MRERNLQGLDRAAVMLRTLLLLAVLAATAHAESKKDRERAAKSTQHPAPPAPGTRAAKLINLYNGWTDEWLAVEPGEKLAPATIDWFFRDHYTNVPRAMDQKLPDILVAAAEHFNSDRVIVVSAFRHPKYNLLLRKKGHQVARDSHHTQGDAVDFQIPRVKTETLHAWAKDQKIGGVGIYLQSGFIHMDTGPVRYWSGE